MATVHILPLSIRPPECTAGAKNQRNFTTCTAKKRPISISFAVNSPVSTPEAPDKVEIELEFIGPKPGDDGEYPIERARAVSGEKLLRNIMLDDKIELYAPYGKVMNCGGGGSCGTCIVEIIDGQDLLNERTNTELRYLKKWHSLSTRGSSLGKGICGRGCTGFDKMVKVLLQPYAVEPNLRRNTTKSSRTKPESWRLACQTIVGNKENSGKVRVQRLPQWKK